MLQEGYDGKTPNIIKTSLNQAGRLKPSLSDIVTHYSFLHYKVNQIEPITFAKIFYKLSQTNLIT